MIIDTHSHIGKDYYCGNISIDDYIDYCNKIGVEFGFVMPTPWPEYYDLSNNKITSLLWEHENFVKKNYFSLKNNCKIQIEANPYKSVNYYYYNEVCKNNSNIDITFIPLIHGVLDEAYYLEKILLDMKPPAVKMHGFGSGFSPDEINCDVISILKSHNIPIILHTSVYNYDYGYGADTRFWRNECHPLRWARFLVNNGLKGVLNHGACLNQEAISIVNSSDNIMIGIGPDLDISQDYFKVDVDKDSYYNLGYLNILKEQVPSEKLLFDVDFNWNNDGNLLDYDQINRLSTIWGYKDMENILSKNAINFFEICKPKIKKIGQKKI